MGEEVEKTGNKGKFSLYFGEKISFLEKGGVGKNINSLDNIQP